MSKKVTYFLCVISEIIVFIIVDIREKHNDTAKNAIKKVLFCMKPIIVTIRYGTNHILEIIA